MEKSKFRYAVQVELDNLNLLKQLSPDIWPKVDDLYEIEGILESSMSESLEYAKIFVQGINSGSQDLENMIASLVKSKRIFSKGKNLGYGR